MTQPLSVVFALASTSRAGGGVSEAARLQTEAFKSSDAVSISALNFHDPYFEKDRPNWPIKDIGAFKVLGPRSFGFSPGLLFALMRAKPDIVHVHGVWQFHCAAVYLWSLITGRPYIVTPHGMLDPWIRGRSRRLKGIVSRLYQDRFLRRASAFQILTTKEHDDIAEFLSYQPAKIIPNFVQPFVSDGIAPKWWRNDFDGRTIFLFLGRIHEKKGCMELCDAWDALCSQNPEFRRNSAMIFCGWNDGLEGFESKVAAISEKFQNILFAGPQYNEEKTRSLSRAAFFVLPSKSEGLPVAILEAWAAKIPVIMTDDCNLQIGFNRGAAIRTSADAKSIERSLEIAFQMPETQKKAMAERAVTLINDRYSARLVRESLLELYQQAIKPKE